MKGNRIARLVAFVCLLATPLFAQATLTVTPLTWNVIGLDSNSPATGPKHFPVGARVCSNVATASITVNWVWDSPNANVNLRPGSLSSVTLPPLAAGACADAYFEVEINQIPAAFNTTRRYHIAATDGSSSASTPLPRELYVEHLISQSRNSITGVKLERYSDPGGRVAEPRGRKHLRHRARWRHRDPGLQPARGVHQFPEHDLPDPVGQHDVLGRQLAVRSRPRPRCERQALRRRLSVAERSREPELPVLRRRRLQGRRQRRADHLHGQDHQRRRDVANPVRLALRFFRQQLPLQRRLFGDDLDREHRRSDRVGDDQQGVRADPDCGRRDLDADLHARQSDSARAQRSELHRRPAAAVRRADGGGNTCGVLDLRLRCGNLRARSRRRIDHVCQWLDRGQQQLHGDRKGQCAGFADERALTRIPRTISSSMHSIPARVPAPPLVSPRCRRRRAAAA